jgi:hypothetical protein
LRPQRWRSADASRPTGTAWWSRGPAQPRTKSSPSSIKAQVCGSDIDAISRVSADFRASSNAGPLGRRH